MKTKFEIFNEKFEKEYSTLNKKRDEVIGKASDREFAEIDFYNIVNKEYDELQKGSSAWEFFNRINDNKKRDKKYNEIYEYNKLTESNILKYAKIKAYSEYLNEIILLTRNYTSNSNKSLIIWNEKKGKKPVYANFLKLAYAIVYSDKYFLVGPHEKDKAIEQLAQFFGVKMGKGWNTTTNNVKEKVGNIDIFNELKINYYNNKKPKQKRKIDKQ